MSHLVTAIVAAMIGAGATALAFDAAFPRDALTRSTLVDLAFCHQDLDACEGHQLQCGEKIQ